MAAKPKGCRVRLCGSLSPSATLAVRASPFVPPAAATQGRIIMLQLARKMLRSELIRSSKLGNV